MPVKVTSPGAGSMTSDVERLGGAVPVKEFEDAGPPRREACRRCEETARSAKTPTKIARAIHVEPWP
jgi:hypothetical protein